MKIYSWNVNGIRAVLKKDFVSWFNQSEADVVCLQETKASPDQLPEDTLNLNGFHSFWAAAEKKGYSGVVTYSKKEPLDVKIGMGVPEIDSEGRVVQTEFNNFVLINAYFPNSQREHSRLDYKLAFCASIHDLCESYVEKGKNIVLCGDYNVAHKEIDLKNPKTNQKNAGFLPEEREWMSEFLDSGYVDAFRMFNTEGDNYTWWSYRPGVREKNIGWRIDYFCVNDSFKKRVKSADIHPKVFGSDHCPISISLS